jgi:endonuclease-3
MPTLHLPLPGKRRPLTDSSLPKQTFKIDKAIRKIRKAIKPYPKAMLFRLFDEGHTTVFEQLLACILSIRTLDESSGPAARGLFALGRTPAALSKRSVAEIDRAIRPTTFHRQKAERILAIARHTHAKYGNDLPASYEVLTSLSGVGPKCAGLALGIAADQPYIGVDVHVHRVTRRWGYIDAPTPERAVPELEAKLPRKYWVEINALLVPFGKHICRGPLPKCSTCPVLSMCRQVGVTRHA